MWELVLRTSVRLERAERKAAASRVQGVLFRLPNGGGGSGCSGSPFGPATASCLLQAHLKSNAKATLIQATALCTNIWGQKEHLCCKEAAGKTKLAALNYKHEGTSVSKMSSFLLLKRENLLVLSVGGAVRQSRGRF